MAFTVEFVAFGCQSQGQAKVFSQGQPHTHIHTRKAKSWEAEVAEAARDAMGSSAPVEWPVAVGIVVVLPIAKSWSKKKTQEALEGRTLPTNKQDLDNHAKSILDACNGILYTDDGQVVSLHVSKRYGMHPCVEVTMIEVVFRYTSLKHG